MINLSIPQDQDMLRPRITICGVGGAGGNAVNNMIRSELTGVEFVILNTDAQAIQNNLAATRIQLGPNLTKGLGAGARPEMGRAAAEEQIDEIIQSLQGSNMVFIAAGMGGGTGTGAAPVIARAARELGILTVGVVTKPFHFEGAHRMRLAESGISELQQYVDTLIVIPNQNLFRLANEKTTFADAFKMADDVLHSGVRGVTDLITMPGLINLDFADIRSVMSEMGKAMMGTGQAEGQNRAIDAAEEAIRNPLLDDVSMKGARGVLINITGGYDMTLFEVDAAANRIREEVDPDANIIFGSTFSPELDGLIRVSVVATGIDAALMTQPRSSSGNSTQAQQPFSVVQNRPTSPTNYAPTPTYNAQVTPARQPVPMPQQQQAPATAASTGYTQVQPSSQSTTTANSTTSSNEDIVRDMPLPSDVSNNSYSEQPVAESQNSYSQQPQSMSMATPTATVSDGAFIAPAPIPTSPSMPQSTVYAPVSSQNSSYDQSNTMHQHPAEERTKRTPSLFERVTGLGLSRNTGPTGHPSQQQPSLSPQQGYNQQPQQSQNGQPQTEDELEIPAFLRRQSN